MKYILFTNSTEIAVCAQNCGVSTIYVDLEILGKESRQANTSSLISYHSLEDISNLRPHISQANLGVRINPINPYIEAEINEVIERGADTLMLPMFRTVQEVEYCLRLIRDRCSLDLLVETPDALDILSELPFHHIRSIHFGINDLSLAYMLRPMFSVLFRPTLITSCEKLVQKNVQFGIGGIGSIDSHPFGLNIFCLDILSSPVQE